MITQHMYRAHIVEEPEWEEYQAWDNRLGDTWEEPWHRPVGWRATPEYTERFDTNKFFEPSTDRWYKSRSSAAERVALLNSMGYTAIVQRSAPVVWPEDGKERVNDSEISRVNDAIRVLKRAGLIKSADEILK